MGALDDDDDFFFDDTVLMLTGSRFGSVESPSKSVHSTTCDVKLRTGQICIHLLLGGIKGCSYGSARRFRLVDHRRECNAVSAMPML